MLRELINKKIDEIFAEYQEANNISSGDIHPWDSMKLDQIKELLFELVQRVCNK